jgi:cyclophilin family peptidyl-prolyl cis-trans isomerase
MRNLSMPSPLTTFCLALALGLPSAALAANPVVAMKTTGGTVTIELDIDKAPKTVENFLAYVDAGFYDNTLFHRVIKGFMIQGGGFTKGMKQKETRPPIENEANNGLKNNRGTIAMARTSLPHSATSQFFVNLVDNNFLNHTAENARGWGYCVFGRVTAGMDVVDTIANVPTGTRFGHGDVPLEDVTILSIRRQPVATDQH